MPLPTMDEFESITKPWDEPDAVDPPATRAALDAVLVRPARVDVLNCVPPTAMAEQTAKPGKRHQTPNLYLMSCSTHVASFRSGVRDFVAIGVFALVFFVTLWSDTVRPALGVGILRHVFPTHLIQPGRHYFSDAVDVHLLTLPGRSWLSQRSSSRFSCSVR